MGHVMSIKTTQLHKKNAKRTTWYHTLIYKLTWPNVLASIFLFFSLWFRQDDRKDDGTLFLSPLTNINLLYIIPTKYKKMKTREHHNACVCWPAIHIQKWSIWHASPLFLVHALIDHFKLDYHIFTMSQIDPY